MTSASLNALSDWSRDIWRSWDRFLFSPTDPATLGLIRILAGAMLLYTHFVWTLELDAFFGANAWLSEDFVYRYHDSVFGWSHLYWVSNSTTLWTVHALALGVFACLMVGFQTRVASILAFLLTVSYAHRAAGALFGLDQINGFLALYLAVGPSGDAFSIDQWLRKRKGQKAKGPSIGANVAIRLIQLHLCIVYLFAGLGKLLGESWWEGTALWGAFANQEYQTLDMTWLASSLLLVNLMTHVTLVWEVSYCGLVWHRHTRPIMLSLAIPLHMGIALCMGMTTFGLVMLIANLSFVSPEMVRKSIGWLAPKPRLRETAIPAQSKPHSSRRKAMKTANKTKPS